MADVIRLAPVVRWVAVSPPKQDPQCATLLPTWQGRVPDLYHVADPTALVGLIDDTGTVAQFGATMIEVRAGGIDWSQTTAQEVVCCWRA